MIDSRQLTQSGLDQADRFRDTNQPLHDLSKSQYLYSYTTESPKFAADDVSTLLINEINQPVVISAAWSAPYRAFIVAPPAPYGLIFIEPLNVILISDNMKQLVVTQNAKSVNVYSNIHLAPFPNR